MPSECLSTPCRPPRRPRRVGCGFLFAQSLRSIPQRLGWNRSLLPDSRSGLAGHVLCRAPCRSSRACPAEVAATRLLSRLRLGLAGASAGPPNLCLSSQADSPGDGFHEGRQVGAEEGGCLALPGPSGSAPWPAAADSGFFACSVAVRGNRAEREDPGNSRPGQNWERGGRPDAVLWDEGERWGPL